MSGDNSGVNNGGSEGGAGGESTQTFAVPEAYANEAWAQNIKEPTELWNQFANAQKLIGKKGLVVPEDFSDERVANDFFDKIGRPKDLNEYEVEGDADFIPRFKEAFHKSGLNKHQAKSVMTHYKEIAADMIKAQEAKQAQALEKLNADFETDMVKALGSDWPKAAAQGKLFVESRLTTDAQKEALASMSNAQLGVLSFLANEFRKEIKEKTGEDVLPRSNESTGGASGLNDRASLEAEADRLMRESYKLDDSSKEAKEMWTKAMGLLEKASKLK